MIKVTGRKNSITKSRSGHYTASVYLIGTWGPTGTEYPYNERIAHAVKLELEAAQNVINNTKIDG